MKTVFSVAFFPPVEFFLMAIKSNSVLIETAENYQKQSYRNRCNILTANGRMSLAVPVCHIHSKMTIKSVRIDYKVDWQRKFWRAIESAYNGSPYFQYYIDFFFPFFEKKYEFLFDYDMEILQTVCKLLEIKSEIIYTEHYVNNYEDIADCRQWIHPKKNDEKNYPLRITVPYSQVFDYKFGFTPNLSILDLIFNKGSESATYLAQVSGLGEQ
jgi:hypothetical protein